MLNLWKGAGGWLFRIGQPLRSQVRPLRGLSCFLALLALLNTTSPLQAQASYKIIFKHQPEWVVSGAWSPDGGTLLLADVLQRKILIYDIEKGRQGSRRVPVRGFSELSRPSILHAVEDGYLVEQEDGYFVKLDFGLDVAFEIDLFKESASERGKIASVFGWVPVGSDLLTLSDVELPDGSWTTGFFRVPLAAPHQFQLVHELESDEDLRYYLVGSPYLASSAGKGYFLLMSEVPRVFEVDFSSAGAVRKRDLGALPLSEYQLRPSLPEQAGPAGSELVFRKLQESTLPAGLYGQGGRLFVLLRKPADNGRTSWKLAELETGPSNGLGLRKAIALPSSSAHLTVIPGPELWGLLEKGPVRGINEQRIETLRLIDSSIFSLKRAIRGR